MSDSYINWGLSKGDKIFLWCLGIFQALCVGLLLFVLVFG